MRTFRLLLPALTVALALTACSSDDSSDDKTPADATSQTTAGGEASPGEASEGAGQSPVPVQPRDCQATVEVTGKVEAAWKGKATVRGEESGPSAVYLTADGKKTVTAYAKGEGFNPSVNFYDGKQVFATAPGSGTGLDIRPNGKSAEVDAEAFNVEGDTVQIVVSFDCSKKKKG